MVLSTFLSWTDKLKQSRFKPSFSRIMLSYWTLCIKCHYIFVDFSPPCLDNFCLL